MDPKSTAVTLACDVYNMQRQVPLTKADCVDGAEAREIVFIRGVVAMPRHNVEGGECLVGYVRGEVAECV